MNRRHLAIAALMSLLVPSVFAASTASFLKIPVGARQVGMGQAFTAIANDSNAAWWNPAGLGTLTSREISATDAQLFADTRYDTLSYAHPMPSATVGLSIGYLRHGEIEGRTADRKKAGKFGASDMVAGVSFGRPAGDLHVGGTMKFVRSSIADESATGFAADVGVLMPTKVPGLTFGASLQNVGPGMKFISERDPLPLTVSMGAGYQTPMGLTLSADVKRNVTDEQTNVAVGMEMPLLAAVTARAGYQRATFGGASLGGPSTGLAGFAGGLGLKIFGYSVDYAFTPMGELGAAQRISLTAKF